jgi:hypothetical protein
MKTAMFPPKLAPAILLAAATAGCLGGPDTDEGDAPRGAVGDAIESPCDGAPCQAGWAGLAFVNEAGARRRVLVDGLVACDLDADAACDLAIEAGREVTIHVEAADGSSPCSGDPTASIGACACARIAIRC